MTGLPVIAIVGRPNVGKSTLFNRLTRSRDALVADQPGVTRDRQYGRADLHGRTCILVDTGGLTDDEAGINPLIARQAEQALDEADIVVFMADSRAGLTPADAAIAVQVRRLQKPVLVAANKTDGLDPDVAAADFYALGFDSVSPLAAVHGHGVEALIDELLARLPPAAEDADAESDGTRVALVGRPNVGKSTLINRLVGADRVVAFDQPGTTRDTIMVPFVRDGRAYQLIDTAGVRRRARVDDGIEKFSVIKTLQAIESCQVVVLLLDARDGVTDQDAHLLGHVYRSGRALVLAVNKWDGLDDAERQRIRTELDRKFAFIDYADVHFISALHGTGVGHLYASIDAAHASATADLVTARLTRILEDAVSAHAPPLVHGRRIKLRYAHQGGSNPPRIIIHGNQTDALPDSYRRYLEGTYRKALNLTGTPVRIELRTGKNPYQGRRNPLTPTQKKHRERLLRHVRKRR